MDVAVVGAGISGLTCAAVLAERGHTPHVFAAADAESSTSGAAAAIWYPYDATPPELAVAWGLFTFGRLVDLTLDPATGVTMVECRFFSAQPIAPPAWADAIGYRFLASTQIPPPYTSGYAMRVPLMDAPVYLAYLRTRFRMPIQYGVNFETLEDVDRRFDVIVNCTGYGARTLARDSELEAHRGQVAIVEPLALSYALVSDDEPLTYVIPRSTDCILGGVNVISDAQEPDVTIGDGIVANCARVLDVQLTVKGHRVGLRPFRRKGVRIEREVLRDGRRVVHNYGHGGAGYSLSWGCAHKVAELVET